jgi:hypothetical protein
VRKFPSSDQIVDIARPHLAQRRKTSLAAITSSRNVVLSCCTTRRHAPLDRRSAVSLALRHAKLVGYIFPSLPAFAIIVGPWFAIYRYRYAMTTIGGAICVGALLTATYIIPTGPIGQLKNSRSKLRPPMKSSLLVSICSTLLLFSTERLLSMSWMIGLGVRQIFQIQSGGNLPRPRVRAASAHVLIGERELKAMLSEGRRMWIWTGSADLVPENGGLVPVASQGGYTVLRARH